LKEQDGNLRNAHNKNEREIVQQYFLKKKIFLPYLV